MGSSVIAVCLVLTAVFLGSEAHGGPPGSMGPGPYPYPGSPSPCPTGPASTPEEEANLRIIKDFNNILFNKKNVDLAAYAYMADNIIEHNSMGGDGRERFINDMTFLTTNTPGQIMDIRRYSVDGDLVYVHGRTSWIDREVAFVDIYRLKNGKIVEHWDVIQDWPLNPKNPHAMF